MKQVNRMCFVCRNTYPKNELNRLVKTSEGKIFLDKTGKQSGRGAYICNCQDCVMLIKKQKILNKAFKCEFPLEVYNQLCEELIDRKN